MLELEEAADMLAFIGAPWTHARRAAADWGRQRWRQRGCKGWGIKKKKRIEDEFM